MIRFTLKNLDQGQRVILCCKGFDTLPRRFQNHSSETRRVIFLACWRYFYKHFSKEVFSFNISLSLRVSADTPYYQVITHSGNILLRLKVREQGLIYLTFYCPTLLIMSWHTCGLAWNWTPPHHPVFAIYDNYAIIPTDRLEATCLHDKLLTIISTACLNNLVQNNSHAGQDSEFTQWLSMRVYWNFTNTI